MNSVYTLINSKGERRELEALLEHPQNQYSINFEIIQYKDDADFELNQQGIKFTPFDLIMMFKTQDYDVQSTFINFFDFDKEMILEKDVKALGQKFNRRVIFKFVEQNPVRQIESYQGQVIVTALSQWFQDEVTEIVTTDVTSSEYTLTYPFTYGQLGVGEAIINNDFNTRVPLVIEFVGIADNPRWQIESPFGTVLYRGQINHTTTAAQKITIDSSRGTVELRNAADNSFIDNIFQDQDFTLETWTFMDFKGDYKFIIEHDIGSVLKCDIRYRKIRPIV